MEIKRPTAIEEQIKILGGRKLVIEDVEFAQNVLLSVNYYNFTGYLHTYKNADDNYENISFNQAYRIYLCDRRIRSTILYAIESIEHNLKTKIAYVIAMNTCATSYLNKDIFVDEEEHQKLLQKFGQAINRNSKIPFVKHHIKKYDRRFPIWVAIEIFTLGMVWNCYKNLKTPLKKKIASKFNIGSVYLESWIECISYLRNVCAHYMRLYRFKVQKTPKKSKKHSMNNISHCIYDIINVMRFLMPSKDEWNNYIISNIAQIFEEYKDVVSPEDYGFPKNWEKTLTL